MKSNRQERIKNNNIRKNTPKGIGFDNRRMKKTRSIRKLSAGYPFVPQGATTDGALRAD